MVLGKDSIIKMKKMSTVNDINDTGERILPALNGETSIVFSRHKFAYDYVRQFVAGKIVLDVGCGSGYGCSILAEKAQQVYGIDQSSDAIEYCSKNFASSNISFIQMDGNEINLQQKFDITTTFQAIEHIENLDLFIQQLVAVTKPGGFIYISTPNVKKSLSEKDSNPFHVNEMNYNMFNKLLSTHFSNFEIIGVAYANKNRMRSIIAKSPIYKWGRKLNRTSSFKQVAARALDFTNFKIITTDVENNAADLFAVCQNL